MSQTTPQSQAQITHGILFLSLELGKNKWLLTFGVPGKSSRIEIDAGDWAKFQTEVQLSKRKYKLPQAAPVFSCYEAGRDGFWIHRYLHALGIKNTVVDSASIEVNRHKRRAKNDQLDGAALLRMLFRYHGGERGLWRTVNVPSAEAEDARLPHREMQRLKKDRNAQIAQVESLLALCGVRLRVTKHFAENIENARLYDGKPLPANMKAEIKRHYERIQLMDQQIALMNAELAGEIKAAAERLASGVPAVTPREKRARQIYHLTLLRGIGMSARILCAEFFSWRDFKNGREVGALAGLTGTPYSSGESSREQGISKAGNKRVRTLMVELAWCWLKYQPGSKLSIWFRKKFDGIKRSRKRGIVAVARRLLVALWRYVEKGQVPEGAVLKTQIA